MPIATDKQIEYIEDKLVKAGLVHKDAFKNPSEYDGNKTSIATMELADSLVEEGWSGTHKRAMKHQMEVRDPLEIPDHTAPYWVAYKPDEIRDRVLHNGRKTFLVRNFQQGTVQAWDKEEIECWGYGTFPAK